MSIDYIQRFWDALAYEAERLLGPYSAELLFARLFRLSPDQATILRKKIRLPTLACAAADELPTVQPPHQFTRASEELSLQFKHLSCSLIGAGLTAILLYAAMVKANRGFAHSFDAKMDD